MVGTFFSSLYLSLSDHFIDQSMIVTRSDPKGSLKCPFSPCETTFTNTRGLISHVKKFHGVITAQIKSDIDVINTINILVTHDQNKIHRTQLPDTSTTLPEGSTTLLSVIGPHRQIRNRDITPKHHPYTRKSLNPVPDSGPDIYKNLDNCEI